MSDKLLRIGKMLSAGAIAGLAIMFALAKTGNGTAPSSDPNAVTAVDIAASLAALLAFGSWFSALWHWGTSHRPNWHKKRWGIVTIFGGFIGGWIYLFAGARPRMKQSSD